MEAFTNASKGLANGAKPNVHAGLVGWASDGFGIYAYQVGTDRIRKYWSLVANNQSRDLNNEF